MTVMALGVSREVVTVAAETSLWRYGGCSKLRHNGVTAPCAPAGKTMGLPKDCAIRPFVSRRQ